MSKNFTHTIAKKLFLFSLLVLFSAARTLAATGIPKITSFSPSSGAVGTTVTISGSGFSATASSDIVFFGATMATVTLASSTSLTVTVPAGATYAPITVLNGSNHLSGYSKNQFIVTFNGSGGISTSTFASPQTFATGNSPQFVTIADIDGDGKPDIVVIDQLDNNVGVYLNKSSGGNITSASFAAEKTFAVGSGAFPTSIAIGDIDGDGKLDIVTSNTGNWFLSVLRNTSSIGNISFAAHADFTCGNNTDPVVVAIADFDGDGKPDLAVTDEATSKVSVFLNTTASGSTTITFATHVDFAVANEPGGMAVGDFDGDGKPDIVATIGSTTEVSVLKNTSTGIGNINFAGFTNFTVGNSPIAVTVSDVDGDGKLDIVTANAGDGTVSILRNNSSGSISFVGHQDITVDDPNIDPNESFYYILMNDLDGDGKPDMIVVDNDNKLYLVKNNSSSGSVSFGSVVTVPVGTNSFALYGVAIGDLNSDGKPDMAANAFGDNQIDVLQNNSITIVATPTTTSLSSNNNPSFSASPGNSVVFTATVTHSGSPVTEGTVSFTSNGVAISGGTSVAVNGNGQAIVNTSYSSTGAYTIVATYNGDVNYSTSTSNSLTQNVDLHPTTISSLTAVTGTTTNASTIQWTATFAASISGLSSADFSLNTTGVSGASIASVSGSGTSWTITANTGSGDGTIQLAMNSASGLTPSVSNLPFNGTTYTIDKTAPTVSIGAPSVSSVTTGTSSVTYNVTYGDAHFNSATLSTSNITLNSTGGASGTVAVAANSSTSYTVTVSSITGTGTLGISIAAGTATDLAGNTAPASGASTTFNVVLPTTTVTEVLRDSSNPTQGGTVSYLVEFADAITGLSAADFTLNSTGSVSGASIGTISGSGTAYTINVNTGTGEGTVTLNFTSSSGLDHTVTNSPFNGQAFTIDQTPPVVTGVQLPADGTYGLGGALQFVVSFNEPVTVSTAGGTPYIGVTLNTGGTVHATYVSGSTSQQLTFTYTVVSGNGDPDGITVDNAITFNGATFSDFAGNLASSEPLTGIGSTSGILVDAVPPTVNSIALVESSPTNATSLDYTVTFSKPVGGVGIGAFSLTTTGGVSGNVSSVTPVSSSVYTVNVNSINGNGTLRLDLSNPSGIFDLNSNQLAGTFTSGDVYTIDNTPPTLADLFYEFNSRISSTVGGVGQTASLGFDTNETIQTATVTIAGHTVTVDNSRGGNNYSADYTMTSGDTEGRVPFTLTITDLAGNTSTFTDVTQNDDIEFDMTPPTVAISAPSVAQISNNGSGTVTYSVTFADPNFYQSSLAGSNLTLNTTGTANGTVGVSGSGTSYTVTISNITGLGTLGITTGINAAQDLALNGSAATPSATFNVLSSDATLSSLAVSNGTLTPTFSSATTSYTAAVGYGLASINITPTVHVTGATLKINGTTAPSGSATSVPLVVGINNVSITVTAQDGSTQQTYTIAITEAQSYNNNLASVKTSAGLAQGSTVPSTLTESVANPVTSLTVTPTVADPTATVTVNNVAVTSGQPSASIPLSVGSNTITIVVTAQDTRTQTYTINVTRAPSANDKLSNLVVSSGTLSPAFGTATNYVDYVANGIPFSITPTLADPTATLTINGTSAPSGTPTTVPLTVGNNTVTIVVTAQNTTGIKTYTVIVNEARSPNSTLLSLTTSAGFSQGQTVPTTLAESVPNATSSITVTPTVADNTATVTVNGTPVTSGSPSAAIALGVGGNTITIVGTAQNGNITTYTLTVTRAASSLLTNLAATAGSLSPAFASTTTSYAIYAVAGTTGTTITPTAADPNAIIKVNGSTVNSGSASAAIPLTAGNTIVTIAVTAADNSTTTTYTVGVNVARSPNNTLISFATSGGLSQGQTVPTTLTESVPYSMSTITVTPTTVDANATVTVNNVSVTSGNASGPIALNVGSNTITTVVTAQNGTPLTYTLTVTRAASANLSNLTLSSGTLSPAFASGTTAYSSAVGNGVTSITVKPTASDPNASIKVNGSTVASGSSSSSIPLTVGNNNITVTVRAADNSSTITYNVGVNRARSSNDALLSYKTSAGLAKGIPVPTTLTESVVNATSTITITPTVQDATATVTVNNVTVTSGTASASIPLAVGPNTITTVVTAQSGVSLTYTLTVTRAMGSMNIVYQPIGVTKPNGDVQLADDGINVHQGISPNGDGINDFLVIENITSYPDNKLQIMNRNGQLVYEAKGYDNATKAFDGHSNKNGQMQLPGTYFYSLDYTIDGVAKHKTGFLVLKY